VKRIIGRKPVLEALNKNVTVDRVYIAFNQHGKIIDAIIVAAKKRGINVTRLSAHKFTELEKGSNSQGVIAIASDLRFYSIDEIFNELSKVELPLVLLLDSIQDPHNLGAILRTADAAGVNAVFSTVHKSVSFTDVVEKTSAGAVNHLKICRVHKLSQVMELLKSEGFWIVGTSLKGDKFYDEIKYDMPTAVVLGNEGKGMRPSIESKCDFLVKIPMLGKVQSLNVSVSTGIMLYEIVKQRKNKLIG